MAISLPIPRPAPVTMATRSLSLATMAPGLEPASDLLPAERSTTEPLPHQRPDRPERLPPARKLALAAPPAASPLKHLHHLQPPPQRPGDDARLVVPAVVGPEVHSLRDLPPEGVVAGAEVREAGAVEDVADGGDGAVAEAPVQRLIGEAGGTARPLGEVVAQEQRLQEAWDLLRVRLAVRVQGDDDVAAGLGDAVAQGIALAEPRLLQYPHLRPQPSRQLPRSVCRVPVDENDLVDPGRYPSQDVREGLPLVQGAEDGRHRWRLDSRPQRWTACLRPLLVGNRGTADAQDERQPNGSDGGGDPPSPHH